MLNPYLFYSDNCEAAFKFYEKVLGGKIEMMLRPTRRLRICRRHRTEKRSCMHAYRSAAMY